MPRGRTARVVVSLAWAVASVDAWKKKQAVEEPPSTFDPMQAVEEAGSLFTHFSSALAGGSLGGEDRLPKVRECGGNSHTFHTTLSLSPPFFPPSVCVCVV